MNNDFPLKVRLHNIFWSFGCYTRLEVKLAEYGSPSAKPMELTDLDVLGVRILPDLGISYLLADCTTNKDYVRSPAQRMFWLKGVMDLFGATKGYISLGTNNPVQEVQRYVAQKLGITILDEKNLSQLEKRVLNRNINEFHFSKPESWNYYDEIISNIRKEFLPLLKFRKYRYWINEPHENIHMMISSVSKCASLFDPKDKGHKCLVYDLLSLFALSVLQMSAYAFHINPENPEVELKAYFYGGQLEMQRRNAIVGIIKKLTENHEQHTNAVLPLDPNYLPHLFDVALRLYNKPTESKDILRFLEVILFEKVLYNNLEYGLYLDAGFSDLTIKLTRDIARLFCLATELNEDIFVDIFSD